MFFLMKGATSSRTNMQLPSKYSTHLSWSKPTD